MDLNVFRGSHHRNINKEANLNNEQGDDFNNDDYIVRSPKRKSTKKLLRQIKYKKPINIDAKQILSDYHLKTHFKGAESASIAVKRNRESNQRRRINLQPLFNSNSTHDVMPQELSPQYHHLNQCSLKKNRSAKRVKTLMDYTRNQNPKIEDRDEEDEGSLEKIEQLKEMIRRGSSSLPTIMRTRGDNNDQENEKYGRNDELIHIGNKAYSIKNQFDIIAHKMLQKCNVYHHKNKNNNSFIKSKQGKLMFTNGMTIKEFEAKYNFGFNPTINKQ